MSQGAYVTLVGFVAQDPTIRTTATGKQLRVTRVDFDHPLPLRMKEVLEDERDVEVRQLDRRLEAQLEIAIAYPIAKETVRSLDCGRPPLHPQKIQRSNPGFESYLTQRISYPVRSPLPQTFHCFPPQDFMANRAYADVFDPLTVTRPAGSVSA